LTFGRVFGVSVGLGGVIMIAGASALLGLVSKGANGIAIFSFAH
jgi:hypothetical protein